MPSPGLECSIPFGSRVRGKMGEEEEAKCLLFFSMQLTLLAEAFCLLLSAQMAALPFLVKGLASCGACPLYPGLLRNVGWSRLDEICVSFGPSQCPSLTPPQA